MDTENLEKANKIKKEIDSTNAKIMFIKRMFNENVTLRDECQRVEIPDELKDGILHLVGDYYENKLNKLKEEFDAL